VGTAGAEVLLPLARVIFVVYFVNILHAVVVYSGAVRIFAGMSPVQFFKGFFEATDGCVQHLFQFCHIADFDEACSRESWCA